MLVTTQTTINWKKNEFLLAVPLIYQIIRERNETTVLRKHLTDGGLPGSTPCLILGSAFPGDSGFPPVFFSSLALLKITVNPSAEAGSLTSHSPNLGSGLPFSC